MTDHPPSMASGGAIREEAATWFARMRGPDAASDRPAFEVWLAESPVHRDAYSRIAEVFSLGKGLGAPPPPPIHGRDRPRAPRRLTAAACAVVIVAAGSGTWLWTQGRPSAPLQPIAARSEGAQPALAYVTALGMIKSWQLADGSKVTLDTGSALQIVFTPTVRTLRLLRGRARFDVAHERRPFIVSAGAGTVTAHGTLFDVRIRVGGAVSVRLLRGAIDVALPASAATPRALLQRLIPGEQVVFDQGALPAPRAVATPADARWPEAVLDCDRQTLGAIVAEANRYSSSQIVIPDPGVANLAVSGSFRIDDSAKLVDRLALLFDLAVTHDSRGQIVLGRS
jgi:transmembrane sensor